MNRRALLDDELNLTSNCILLDTGYTCILCHRRRTLRLIRRLICGVMRVVSDVFLGQSVGESEW